MLAFYLVTIISTVFQRYILSLISPFDNTSDNINLLLSSAHLDQSDYIWGRVCELIAFCWWYICLGFVRISVLQTTQKRWFGAQSHKNDFVSYILYANKCMPTVKPLHTIWY